MIGTNLAHFRITAKLGEGGMGEVYRAEDTKLGREVAIKVLPRELARDPDRLERFQREAKALAVLDHPNIVTVHSVETAEGIDFLVMSLIEGRPLDQLMAAHGMPLRELLELAIPIADALAAAHAKGITHRDLKPGNVMVTDDGRVKILDFGLAKLTGGSADDAETELLTRDGLVLGTVPYMSPEQVQGGEVDHRSDIFSFGVLLYELTTGARPFIGENHAEVISAILRDEPPPVTAVRSDLPHHLGRIIKRCLTKQPDRRPQSALDLRNELEDLSRELETHAVPSAPKARLSRPIGRWLAIAIVVVALASLGLWWSSGRFRPASSAEWTQLTHFTDSVTSPAISPDGRMVAYLRGASTFIGAADLYVQTLPDGEPVRLTRDGSPKMTPSFAPDGFRIAYSKTILSTWVMSVLGGESRELMTNASELSWVGEDRVMFSEFREGIHMAVVTSTESRRDLRDVYVPESRNGMAHRSYLSPDGRLVLIAEMDDGGWLPCRVVPFDGSSMGHRVGPPGAPCVDGAWSPDAEFVYLTVGVDNEFHIWRQRYPDGEPQQVTTGPTQQAGIAMSPDGDYFITAAGNEGSAIWLGTPEQERQVTFQGESGFPILTANGKTLYYLERKTGTGGQLMRLELDRERSEPVLPGFRVEMDELTPAAGSFDVSPDGRAIASIIVDDRGNRELWLYALDDGESPVKLSAQSPYNVRFGTDEELFFAGMTEDGLFAYRTGLDDSNPRRVLDDPVIWLEDVSMDGKWMIARMGQTNERPRRAPVHEGEGFVAAGTSIWTHRIDGSEASRLLCSDCFWVMWGPRERYMYFQIGGEGTWLALPIPEGQLFPELPPEGLPPIAQARTMGQIVVEGRGGIFMSSFYPGPDPSSYAVSRPTAHRNLYRVPIP